MQDLDRNRNILLNRVEILSYLKWVQQKICKIYNCKINSKKAFCNNYSNLSLLM